ncbi:hypothetical protein [Luteolibacter luteus]|uniref:Uncharacterized protein n=1 Tax=Luteolibacter luteus TaxID=2728835 RepID=A0A858RP17_9BACT|nr:hypothetical protein [Luteolibacter luteus]QJE98254.1 hypothetical protein HHL09_21540 [Luteolibacter luteus]
MVAVLLSAGLASAEIPRKAERDTYSKLWEASPFTTKPINPLKPESSSPMADWTLGGVSEIHGGYVVTLVHKKNAGESMIIRPDGVQKTSADKIERGITPGEAGTFKLDRVDYGQGGWKDISVHLSDGARLGVVRFDEKNLVPKTSAPAAGNRPGPSVQPNQANPQGAPGTPGRPRLSAPPK